MPAVVRRGDANSAGGIATQGAATVFVNGRGVVPPGSPVTPHPCCGSKGCDAHCSAVTTGGSATVFAEGKPIILVGDNDTCGHARAQGSPNVFIGS
jgi:uncharacterized Zn-binding protein involved in type VI secretion